MSDKPNGPYQIEPIKIGKQLYYVKGPFSPGAILPIMGFAETQASVGMCKAAYSEGYTAGRASRDELVKAVKAYRNEMENPATNGTRKFFFREAMFKLADEEREP